MKSLILTTLASLLLIATFPGVQAEPNEMQSGENGLCDDYNVLYNVDNLYSPLAAMVTVAGGTNYEVSQSGGAVVFVDFYNAAGAWLGYNEGAATGRAPASAVTGTMCVAVLDNYPDLPAAGATWTYQDGF